MKAPDLDIHGMPRPTPGRPIEPPLALHQPRLSAWRRGGGGRKALTESALKPACDLSGYGDHDGTGLIGATSISATADPLVPIAGPTRTGARDA